jgi:hypothetical protein
MYLWRRLRLAHQREEFDISAPALAALDEDTFNRAFADDEGENPLSIAADSRIANLRDLGSTLMTKWGGWFERVVSQSSESLEIFARHSSSFRAFDDPLQKLTMLNAIMLQGSGLVRFDKAPLPAIDYHLVKQAVRQGLVRPGPSIGSKLRDRSLLTQDESTSLRRAVLSALLTAAEGAGTSSAVIDNLYWLNRRICADTDPECGVCPFKDGCEQHVELGLPLELTRYY